MMTITREKGGGEVGLCKIMRYTRGPPKHERTMNKHEGGFVLSNETHQKPIETQDNNEQM